jgi:hypothetical protein
MERRNSKTKCNQIQLKFKLGRRRGCPISEHESRVSIACSITGSYAGPVGVLALIPARCFISADASSTPSSHARQLREEGSSLRMPAGVEPVMTPAAEHEEIFFAVRPQVASPYYVVDPPARPCQPQRDLVRVQPPLRPAGSTPNSHGRRLKQAMRRYDSAVRPSASGGKITGSQAIRRRNLKPTSLERSRCSTRTTSARTTRTVCRAS